MKKIVQMKNKQTKISNKIVAPLSVTSHGQVHIAAVIPRASRSDV